MHDIEHHARQQGTYSEFQESTVAVGLEDSEGARCPSSTATAKCVEEFVGRSFDVDDKSARRQTWGSNFD